MRSCLVNCDWTFRAVLVISGDHAHPLNNTHSRIYSTKYCMFVVQPWSRFQRDEELAAISVRSRIRHRHDTRPRVLQVARDFVFELSTVYTLPAPSCSRRITSLDHKVPYDSMKDRSIIIARLRQGRDVMASPRRVTVIQLDDEGTNGRFKLDVCVWGWVRHLVFRLFSAGGWARKDTP